MDKLKLLCSKCTNSVQITVNLHRDCHESVSEYIDDLRYSQGSIIVNDDILSIMIERDTMVDVQFYPRNAVGSYSVFHYDIELAMDEALKIMEDEPKYHDL